MRGGFQSHFIYKIQLWDEKNIRKKNKAIVNLKTGRFDNMDSTVIISSVKLRLRSFMFPSSFVLPCSLLALLMTTAESMVCERPVLIFTVALYFSLCYYEIAVIFGRSCSPVSDFVTGNRSSVSAAGYSIHVDAYATDPLDDLMNGEVKSYLGIPPTVTWGGQSNAVFNAQAGDFMKPVIDVGMCCQLVSGAVNEKDFDVLKNQFFIRH